MGSVDMAFNKILSVLLVAGSAWTNPQNNFFNFNDFATQRPIAPSPTVSTTPVPILRDVDTQNIDGSYTYGYEAADGTYKLETRYPDGNLREASYGAEAGRGFEPQIEGLELPPPVTTPEEAFNEIPEQVPQKQFQNFQPTENTNDANKFKIVNGRRALVKKVRRVKASPAPKQFIDEAAAKRASLKARQEQLRSLEQHRQQLLEVQQQQQRQQGVNTNSRQQQSRAFSSFPSRQESFRSVQPVAVAPSSGVSDPFISDFNLRDGSYSYSY